MDMADIMIGNAIRVLNVQGEQIGHLPRTLAARLAKYMDNRTLLVEAHITGHKGAFECPIELKYYGTNEPMEREELLRQMRADRLPIGHAAEQRRKDDAAKKERQRLAKEAAKQAKKKGGAVVGVGEGQDYENGMSEYMAGQSQGDGLAPGPSLEDIIGNSERFNPRNVEQMVEEFGIKEDDLVSDRPCFFECLLTFFRRRCLKPLSQRRSKPSYIPSSCKVCNGCWIKRIHNCQHKIQRTWFSYGNVIRRFRTPSRTLRRTFHSQTQRLPLVAYLQMTWAWAKLYRQSR